MLYILRELINIDKQQIVLPVQLVHYLAEGCIGYPVGQVSIIHPSMPASICKVAAPIMMSDAMAGDMASMASANADFNIDSVTAAPTTTQEV